MNVQLYHYTQLIIIYTYHDLIVLLVLLCISNIMSFKNILIQLLCKVKLGKLRQEAHTHLGPWPGLDTYWGLAVGSISCPCHETGRTIQKCVSDLFANRSANRSETHFWLCKVTVCSSWSATMSCTWLVSREIEQHTITWKFSWVSWISILSSPQPLGVCD